MVETGITQVTYYVGIVIAICILGMVTSWIDRKVTARIHARIGPPWYQPLADILKLMGKETLIPEEAGPTVFLLSPLVGLAGAAVAAFILGSALINPEWGFVGDIIVLVYFLTVPAAALILGASASGNPVAAVGASREMKQLMAYELPYLIVLVMVIYKSGFDLRLGGIIASQANGVHIGSISGVIAFIVLLLATHAKLGLVPFDSPEAEQEIMGGVTLEYSGLPLAMIKLTTMMLLAIMPLFMVAVLMGGLRLEGLGILWAVLKYVGIIVLIVLIRNTNPRVRIDQSFKFFWGPVTILALIALGLNALGL
jgi:NADH-quinone oxidoreductase subunit H